VSQPATGNTLSDKALDQEFGAGTGQRTRRLKHTGQIKLLFQINQLYKDPQQTQPYGGENIHNAIADLESHGLSAGEYDIVALVHAEGWRQVLNNRADHAHEMDNPFQSEMEALIETGASVYFCLNTARKKSVKAWHVISGIKFVTSGVTAIADWQRDGYCYIQP
jgi:intracellular sulfur oxidation DsrE/DsrF family protein